MDIKIINQIIKQEIQLLNRTDSPDILAELIDDEFVEIGSSTVVNDKTEVVRWLASDDKSEYVGDAFKAYPLAENILILTYISTTKGPSITEKRQTMRSSIWRLTNGHWRMVFHQGTPLK
ncbi:nuclear transport factor 2 family protein [Legionella clemsonensis]|nr:DUF4440 domain-containing protein [Legionella clemsonensis]